MHQQMFGSRIWIRYCASLALSIGTSSALAATVVNIPARFDLSPIGAATYTIPIELPRGTNGLTPTLAVSYNTHAGNGLLGVGMSLVGFPTITRCDQNLAQDGVVKAVAVVAADKLCLDGNRLRLTSGTYGATGSKYQTEIETYSQVIANGTTGFGPQWFEVKLKNGLSYEFGNTTDSRIGFGGSTTKIRVWALNKIRDRNGNYILYTYTQDTANGSYVPSSIQYTGNTAQGLTPAYNVSFYTQTRFTFDTLVSYDSGYKIKQTKYITQISIFYNGANSRHYFFSLTPTPPGNRSTLTAVYRTDVGNTQSFASNVSYQTGSSNLDLEQNLNLAIPTGAVVHSIDANADGRSDLVFPAGGTWHVSYGQRYGFYTWPDVDTGIAATNPAQSHSIDYSGDGWRDVIYPDGSGNWAVLQFAANGVSLVSTGKPANGASGGLVAIQDVDGDGLDDVVSASGATLKVRLNSATGLAATESTFYTAPTGWVFDTDAFGTAGVDEYKRDRQLIDFNRDRRGDLVAKLKQTSTNTIQWKTLIAMGTSYAADVNLESASTQRPLLLDLNGDGLTDALGHNGTTWVVQYAQGGADPATLSVWDPTKVYPNITNALTEAIATDLNSDGACDVFVPVSGDWNIALSTRDNLLVPVPTGYAVTSNHNARSVDIGGDGLKDLSYASGGNWVSRKHTGDIPDLATSFTDPLGNYTTVFYQALPSMHSGLYSRDAEPVFPNRRFTGALPVVWTYTTSDAIGGNYWTNLTYMNANVHVQGRGFLGFSYQSRWDSRTSVLTDIFSSQTFPYIGRATMVRSFADAKKFSELANTLASITAGTGFNTRAFPYVSSSNQKRWEVGGAFDQALVSDATTTTLMDTSGNAYDVTTTTTEPATANGIQSGIVYTDRTYTPLANMVNDTTNWCLGQETQIQTIRSHTGYGGASVTRTRNQTWDAVKCRITGETIEPASATLKITRTFAFDGFGNRNSETTTGIGMVARTTTTNWGTSGQFPTTVTNPLSETTTFGYDFVHGVLTSTTDANGIQSTKVLDTFGRVIRENRPDGTALTRDYEICSTYSVCKPFVPLTNTPVIVEKTLDTASNVLTEQWILKDQFERPYATKQKQLSGAFNWTEKSFDNRGLLATQGSPCWHASCTTFLTTNAYDQLNRLTSSSRPNSATDPTVISTTIAYEGLTTRTTDPLGKQTTSVRKVSGALARTTDANGYAQTTDHDAFQNPVRVQDSLGQTLQTATFDVRGNRTARNDADLGNWTFVFNALGEMTSQTDANTKVTSFTYDKLSRMTQRVEPEGAGNITSTWTWGVLADNTATNKYIGRLKQQQISGTGVSTYVEANTFDAIGRQTQTQYTENGNTYSVDQSYHTTMGYRDTLTYPTSTSSYRLKLQYEYQNGRLNRVKDFNAPTTVFWQANSVDPRGTVVDETFGNGLQSVVNRDPVTERLGSIATGPSGTPTVQNLAYAYDKVGNVIQRQDNNQGLTENFYYDNVHRLDNSTLGGSQNLDVTLDNAGNITNKTGVGTYTYHGTKIHAVSSIAIAGGGTMTFGYDNNGNMTNRNGTTLAWLTNNLPKTITKDANNWSSFEYGPHRARWRQTYVTAGTTYTHTYIGKLIEKVVTGGTTDFRHFINVNGQSIAIVSRKSTGTNASTYRLDDHLGSTEHLTDSAGANVVMESFGAYGQRRGSNWTGAPTSGELTTINDKTRKGFTEHEMLDNTDLVHMTGRVYDPVIGRFASSDPLLSCADNGQKWNRYAYVKNSPLSRIDPSGLDDVSLEEFLVSASRVPNFGSLQFIGSRGLVPVEAFAGDYLIENNVRVMESLADALAVDSDAAKQECQIRCANEAHATGLRFGTVAGSTVAGAQFGGGLGGAVIGFGAGLIGIGLEGLLENQQSDLVAGVAAAAASGNGLDFGPAVAQSYLESLVFTSDIPGVVLGSSYTMGNSLTSWVLTNGSRLALARSAAFGAAGAVAFAGAYSVARTVTYNNCVQEAGCQ
jgi:RHS repeat-associated protein